jgi:hypothetical protein
VDREARVRAGTVISARDEIWIDMIQFDVRAADRLWEGTAPAEGAPGWYDDVSGLIGTATGPAEAHELVDEPIVVEDMHHTTLDRSSRRRHQRRTVGRVMAMKAAAATTASVLGVAAAAAATTGIFATVAGMVVPVIEKHVLLVTDDTPESGTPATPAPGATLGSPDPGVDDQGMAVSAPPASPAQGAATPGPSAPAADPGSAPSVTTAPTAPAFEPVIEPAPLPAPAAAAPGDARPDKSAPRTDEQPTARPDKARPATGGQAGGRACGHGSCSGRPHHGGQRGDHGDTGGEISGDSGGGRAPPGQLRRAG